MHPEKIKMVADRVSPEETRVCDNVRASRVVVEDEDDMLTETETKSTPQDESYVFRRGINSAAIDRVQPLIRIHEDGGYVVMVDAPTHTCPNCFNQRAKAEERVHHVGAAR